METYGSVTRRGFLGLTVVAIGGCAGREMQLHDNHSEAGELPVTATEDLMREHGVLSRILLIYDEAVHRAQAGNELPMRQIVQAARIVRQFIEDYHEKLEEDLLFPGFEKAGKHADLIAVLRRQHQAGRRLTDTLLRLGEGAESGGSPARIMHTFARMYRPHAAREDTVIFPAARDVFGPAEFAELGEEFEEREERVLGKDGYAGVVARVADIERALGIEDLAGFTSDLRV